MNYHLPPAKELSLLQLDGVNCVYCVRWDPSVPVGHIRGCQVFAHAECAEENREGD